MKNALLQWLQTPACWLLSQHSLYVSPPPHSLHHPSPYLFPTLPLSSLPNLCCQSAKTFSRVSVPEQNTLQMARVGRTAAGRVALFRRVLSPVRHPMCEGRATAMPPCAHSKRSISTRDEQRQAETRGSLGALRHTTARSA